MTNKVKGSNNDDDIKIRNEDKITDLKLEEVVIELKICRKCNEHKPRIRDGRFNMKDYRWRGPDGRLWNGLMCPDCHSEKMKHKAQSKKVKNETSESSE